MNQLILKVILKLLIFRISSVYILHNQGEGGSKMPQKRITELIYSPLLTLKVGWLGHLYGLATVLGTFARQYLTLQNLSSSQYNRLSQLILTPFWPEF